MRMRPITSLPAWRARLERSIPQLSAGIEVTLHVAHGFVTNARDEKLPLPVGTRARVVAVSERVRVEVWRPGGRPDRDQVFLVDVDRNEIFPAPVHYGHVLTV